LGRHCPLCVGLAEQLLKHATLSREEVDQLVSVDIILAEEPDYFKKHLQKEELK
jgi:hypothetical protein